MAMKLDHYETIEAFRHAVLKTLDATADELFGCGGWQDQDLPELFKAVDAFTEKAARRNGVELVEAQ